ncbi:MAG: bifunctional glutamate N-acetyltransferase/amino-acid acetyltransferase ArgJ [Thioalkalivibrionaceae bacterium]
MPVAYRAVETVDSVPGIEVATAAAGIRYRDRDDLVLFRLAKGATVTVVTTQNRFCAAPVRIVREHMALAHEHGRSPVALLINAGNANAGTGADGLRRARDVNAMLAAQLGIDASQVLPFSTGVIGEPLPLEPFERALPVLIKALKHEDGPVWIAAAKAIATTDIVHKAATRRFAVSGGDVVLTGVAKGSGMIHPNMATMLAFVGTNARLAQADADRYWRDVMARSFNAITVDGDTSTNDCAVLMARSVDSAEGVDLATDAEIGAFREALESLCVELAEAIVRDGEGATKFVDIRIDRAKDDAEARAVAETVASSPLVKTALFASDPNWGRILAAVGRAPVAQLLLEQVTIDVNGVRIVEHGGRAANYTEAAGAAAFAESDIRIVINLGVPGGTGSARKMTCDFSYDYVRINAEYRS